MDIYFYMIIYSNIFLFLFSFLNFAFILFMFTLVADFGFPIL